MAMSPIDLLRDLASRPLEAITQLRPTLSPEVLNEHPGGHDNSIAWLLWHMGREIDSQTAHLAGREQLWTSDGYQQRFGIDDGIGYGHSPSEARGVVVDDPKLLLEYVEAAAGFLDAYLSGLDSADLSEVIDDSWDPPVTRGARLVSIIDDAAQHAGQVGYALGILTG